MKRFALAIIACLVLCAFPVRADEPGHPGFRPDDRVVFDVSAEDWVTTKTAHVSVTVEAAVNASTAGSMREDMVKAVNALAKADWRLTSFDRSQDQTGLERWSAVYEARLPESDLGSLGDAAKKLSKAGMQLSIGTVDFTPTLEETETTRSSLRTQIYKIANDQLAALNAAMPDRSYRIALVDFTGDDGASPLPRVIKGRAPMMAMMAAPGMQEPEGSATAPAPVERAEKIMLTARVVFAAASDRPALAPLAPPDIKH
jgi:hypothetical protein